MTEEIPINKGVKQSVLYIADSSHYMYRRHVKIWNSFVGPGIFLKGMFLNFILYADDMVIIEDSENKLQKSLYILNRLGDE